MHVEPKKDAPSRGRADHGHRDTSSRTRVPRISEIHASTMARPQWWDSHDGEGPGEPHHSSFVDTILDSNICFVDTPGHECSKVRFLTHGNFDVVIDQWQISDAISLSHEYIESHLRPHLSSSVEDSDMLRMLGGSGGSLVSAVLYLIPPSGKYFSLQALYRIDSYSA